MARDNVFVNTSLVTFKNFIYMNENVVVLHI